MNGLNSGKNRGRRAVFWVSFFLVSGFLALCNTRGLLADFRAAQWRSLAGRITLMVVLAAPAALRLRQGAVAGTPAGRGRLVLVVVFLGVLFYPLMSQTSFLARSGRDVGRELLRRNGGRWVTLFRQFPGAYEKYFSRHFTLPKALINFQALIKIYGLGVSPNPTVAVGKNGFYFEGYGARKVEKGIIEQFDNIADYMGQIPFTGQELRQWKQTLEERSYWLKEQGINYVFVLAPTKAFVYPEDLPDQLQSVRGQTRYEQLSRYLREHADIHFIDLLPPLLKAKKERQDPLLFYKTDFHWNFYGSFVAYQAMLDSLRRFFPQYKWNKPVLKDFDFKINKHWAHHRFMNMIGLPVFLQKHEHYITMVPRPGTAWAGIADLPAAGIFDVYPPVRKITDSKGESMDIRLVLNPKAPINSILLLGDSFMEKCVYYFSANARRVLNDRTIVNFPDRIFTYEKPDIVIQEILNMFILRPPPRNPPGFRAAYLREKFNRFGEKPETVTAVPGRSGVSGPQTGHGGCEIPLPGSGKGRTKGFRVGRLRLQTDCSREIRLRFRLDDGSMLAGGQYRVSPANPAFYFELPKRRVTELLLSAAGNDKHALRFRDLEVRRIRNT